MTSRRYHVPMFSNVQFSWQYILEPTRRVLFHSSCPIVPLSSWPSLGSSPPGDIDPGSEANPLIYNKMVSAVDREEEEGGQVHEHHHLKWKKNVAPNQRPGQGQYVAHVFTDAHVCTAAQKLIIKTLHSFDILNF